MPQPCLPAQPEVRQWRQEYCRSLTVTMGSLVLLLACNLASGAPGDADATADARTNAKAALMLAMDALQKSAGPDQRVTARADILDASVAHPHLTGVWKSWEIKATAPPTSADYEKPAKDAKFQGWLVSNPDPEAARQIDFSNQPLADPATLWGAGSLGNTAPVSSFVAAAKVPVTAPAGAYAWAVIDEGVKVRINTPYTDGATSDAAKTMQLGAGERPGVDFIPGLGALRRGYFEATSAAFADFVKGIGDTHFGVTAESIAQGTSEVLKTLTHDVTLHSLGLFTDTARGGFKRDFQLLTNAANLPADYLNLGVYQTRLSMNAPSDPTWASLRDFARLYRDKLTNSGGVPVLKAQSPSDWGAATTANNVPTLKLTPPAGVVLMPTIVNVQMLFSLLTRDLYSWWVNSFGGTSYRYMLHLHYTPIITLHNPYNVALEFTDLRLEFANVPFAAQVYRNGIAQSNGFVPLDRMCEGNNGMVNKRFGINLKTAGGSSGSSTIRLLPGEVKLFSPYLDPSLSFDDGNPAFFDLNSTDSPASLTQKIVAIPGFSLGKGYEQFMWAPPSLQLPSGPGYGRLYGCIALTENDSVHVEFAPLSVPELSGNRFVVQMKATISGKNTTTGAIEMNYESNDGLMMPPLRTGIRRYPPTGTIRASEMRIPINTPISQSGIYLHPFAMFSLRAKTTSGNLYPDLHDTDGRYATKPWCFAHANIGASSQNVVHEHPANHSHEIDLIAILSKGDFYDMISIDAQNRSYFVSGYSPVHGTKFGLQYDIPLAPLQTLASLNGSNPGGSSGYLPRFAQPIGNSWAHPLIAPDKLLVANAGSGYNYLDHSFLLNLALYDSYYFSGLAEQSGPYCIPARTTPALAAGFAAGTPLDDPRLLLYRPNGKTAAAFAGEVAKPAAYANIAAWQLMEGAFNINSTSVPAWKAMLASIHDAQALYNRLDKNAGSSALVNLTSTTAGKTRISRFRLPASTSAADGAYSRDGYWLGPREYSDAELQTLAENIVRQVRLRGPFLSMAEFVNRRLGPSDAKSQRGALQQAVDDSNLNQALANSASAGFEIAANQVTSYNYANPTAGIGSSYQGAPGYLTQADLLNVLGNAATARSDTFTIRSYGEAHDAAGQPTATATCEAIVQRLPDWVDPADAAETAPASLTSESNIALGRRFRLLAFRWLNPDEI